MYRYLLLAVALLALLALLALGACSALRPMSLSDARSFCNTADGSGSSEDGSGAGICRQQLEICAQFFDPLAVGDWDRASCLEQCRQARDALFHVHAMDDCGLGVVRANELCEGYCRNNFPQ